MGILVRSENGAIAKMDASHPAPGLPVVPRFDLRGAALRADFPAWNGRAENLRDLFLAHPALQRKQLRVRDREVVDGFFETACRNGVARLSRQDGAIEAGGIVVATEGRQFAREIELNVVVDLAGTLVRRMGDDEGRQRVGVDLFVRNRGPRGGRGAFVSEHHQPIALVTGRVTGATATGHSDRQRTDQGEKSHGREGNMNRPSALLTEGRRGLSSPGLQATAGGGFMAGKGEEVATSIDAHVREAIEKMVGEVRSSIDDVRSTVDQQLKAAVQSLQADVNAISFVPFVEKSIGELAAGFAAAAPAATPGSDASAVRKAIQTVERGKTQVDILNALLDACMQFGSRAALLILKGETFSGWKGIGFSARGGNDESIKRFNAAPGLLPELDRVLRNEEVVVWDGANLSTRFGAGASERAILVPMVIKDKVAAAIYVDALGDDVARLDPASIEIIVFTTGLLIDTLAIRKKIPSPSFNEPGGDETRMMPAPTRAAAPVSAPAPAPQSPAASVPRPLPTPVPSPPAPAPAAFHPSSAPAMGDATVAVSSAQIREMMASPAPAFNMPSPDEFGGSMVKPPAAPAAPPPPAQTAPAAETERPSTQYVPPGGINRAAAAAPPTEELKKHDEARRFARLLVSEIKLYNESKVEQGRRNRDLYERLKEDIDRSRQMYDERIGEDVRKGSNYFYDELVRILADGSAETLGL